MTRKKTRLGQQHTCLTRLVMASNLCTESRLPETAENEKKNDFESQPQTEQIQEQAQPGKVKFLVVGLGNAELPGTRHSVGMEFVNKLANKLDLLLVKEVFKKFGGFVGSMDLDERVEIILLKPRVPMNINGTSVIRSARVFDVVPENVYLIHDELDKPVGNFRLKEGGSANGHNGVKSVMNSLKSDIMPRICIGIDRPSDEDYVAQYVLEKFESDERKAIRQVINESIDFMLKHMSERCGVELNIPKRTQVYEQDDEEEVDPDNHYRFGMQSFRPKSKQRYDKGNFRKERGYKKEFRQERDLFDDDHGDYVNSNLQDYFENQAQRFGLDDELDMEESSARDRKRLGQRRKGRDLYRSDE